MSFREPPVLRLSPASFGLSVLSLKTRSSLSILLVLIALCGGLYLASSSRAEQAKEYTAEQIVESAIAIAGNGFGRAVLGQIRRNGLEVGKETRTSPDG